MKRQGILHFTGATFNNLAGGTFTASSDGYWQTDSGNNAFNNYGQVTVAVPSSLLSFSVNIPFNNNGTVSVNNGILLLSGYPGTSSGSFSVSSSGSLRFSPGGTVTLLPSSNIGGAGNLQVQSGTVINNGKVSISSIIAAGGTARFTGTVSSSSLSALGGRLDANGPSFTIADTVFLNGGVISGSGTFTLQPGSTFTWTAGMHPFLSSFIFCLIRRFGF